MSRGGQKRAPENLSLRFFWVLEIELGISSEPPFQSLTLALENSFDLLVCVQGVGRARYITVRGSENNLKSSLLLPPRRAWELNLGR